MQPARPGFRRSVTGQQRDAPRRRDRHITASAALRETAERPGKAQLAREAPERSRPAHGEVIEQRPQTRRSDLRGKRGDTRFGCAQRLHRVGEIELAAVEAGVRPRDLEAVARPHQIAVQLGKPEPRQRRVATRERAGQLASPFEQMPDTAEHSRASHREVVAREEDLLHRGQIDVHVPDVVGRLRPVQHVDAAVDACPEALVRRPQVDVRQVHQAAVEHVIGVHVQRHRLEVADDQGSAAEPGRAAVARGLAQCQIDIRRPDAPGCARGPRTRTRRRTRARAARWSRSGGSRPPRRRQRHRHRPRGRAGSPLSDAADCGTKRGNVCRPSANPSTSMRQPRSSTASTRNSPCNRGLHSVDISTWSAWKNGRSPGFSPPISRSSMRKRPGAR